MIRIYWWERDVIRIFLTRIFFHKVSTYFLVFDKYTGKLFQECLYVASKKALRVGFDGGGEWGDCQEA